MRQNHPWKEHFFPLLWGKNQVLRAILGICSALAVSNKVALALTMGISVSLVTSFSSLFVSLLRHKTPDTIRMILQLVVISTFVILIDQFLRAFFYPLSKVLSVFVGLIITNCIVMGRAESMAKHHRPLYAFIDGLGAGLGYTWVLCLIASLREFLAFGTFFELQLIPTRWYASEACPGGYRNFAFFALPASSFFIVGLFIWVMEQCTPSETPSS